MTDTTAQQLVDAMPFSAALGIVVESAAANEVRARISWSEERCTTSGILHGGVLMAFADTLGAVCAFLNLPAGAGTTTIESKTNFFRAAREGTVHAVTTPLHVGRTVVVVQTDLRDDAGRRLAQTTQTQAVLSPR